MRYAIGIDMGGTKIEGILVDEKGKIYDKYRRPTEGHKTSKVVIENIDEVYQKIKNCAKRRKIKVQGVGIGLPGFITEKKITLMPNIPCFEGKDIKKILEKKLKTKVTIANDANCFALAEHFFGAAKGKSSSVGIIWGTGVGGGIIINNKILEGQEGSAGEFGHTVINPDSKVRCACGNYGDIESFISAPNLIKHYKILKGKNKGADSTYIMQEKDSVAKKVSKQAIKYLSILCANLIGTLNPEIIVLGGGVSNSKHYKEISFQTNKFLTKALKNKCKIVKHKVSDSSGAIGAAALVF